MARELTTLYCQQDGADFYIYKTRVCDKLHNTWSYRGRVVTLEQAKTARSAFEDQLKIAGYRAEWPNPFASEDSHHV